MSSMNAGGNGRQETSTVANGVFLNFWTDILSCVSRIRCLRVLLQLLSTITIVLIAARRIQLEMCVLTVSSINESGTPHYTGRLFSRAAFFSGNSHNKLEMLGDG